LQIDVLEDTLLSMCRSTGGNMEFKDMDQASSYEDLKAAKPFNIKEGLSRQRINELLISEAGLLSYSYACEPVSKSVLSALQALSDQQQVIEKYKALLSGKIMNPGEKRCVLHHLARGAVLEGTSVQKDDEEKGAFYKAQLEKIQSFSNDVRKGLIKGSTGKSFDTVVQIGIGGSDLGPRALYIALDNLKPHAIKAHFISNVDPDDAAKTLSQVNIETTMFILVSKSGTTLETLTNRDLVLSLMQARNIEGFIPSRHMIAVTSKTSPLATSSDVLDAFFIDDYIGGRYSATSAVGAVVLSLAFGYDVLAQVLEGAHAADIAALEPDITKNAALMDAMIGIYLRNVLGYPSTAVLPYSQALSRFPAHLQQLDMESNGKRVNRDGKPLRYQSGPVVFGEPGTNGQHSFYQLLHQGTDVIPLQFIGFKSSQMGLDATVDGSSSQEKLLANLIAQMVAFSRGKDDDNPSKVFEGGRPSSLIFADKLDARTLGALLAHFENKVMFQGFVWNINSFDQEGVQLGKILATKVLNGCEEDQQLLAFSALLK